MRRYFRPVLLMMLLLAIASWVLPGLWDKIQEQTLKLKSKYDLNSENTVSSTSYPLDNQNWIKFAIPEQSQKLRIISNAHIDKTENIPADTRWSYSLNYQLLATDSSVLDEQVYHQNSRLSTYVNLKKSPYYANHYGTNKVIVLDGRIIHLSLQSFPQAAFIRLRIQHAQADIEGLAIRIYAPIKISSHRQASMWRRLSPQQRQLLAKGSVFPADLLSESEQINLLNNQWQPMGPVGIEGQEYHSKVLYSLKEISQDKIEPAILLAGLQADANHPATIPIPEQGGQVTLELKMLNGSPMPVKLPLYLRWFGRSQEERWQQAAIWQAEQSLSYQLDGGLLEIRPSAAVVIQASLTTANAKQQDITPEPLRIKSYFADTGVVFKIEHLAAQATPLRVDVRRFFNGENLFSPEALSPAMDILEYQWLDAAQRILHRGTLKIMAPASIYDRLKSITAAEKISDPQSYYWRLPAQVNYVRFTSHPDNRHNIVVNAYNQPIGMLKQSKIPEDAYVNLDKKSWQPSWFSLPAHNAERLLKQQQLLWIAGQYHPPKEKSNPLAGDYSWNEYLPEKPYQAHYLLEKYTKQQLREQALSSVYCELPKLENFTVQLQAPSKLRNFSSEMWFLKPDKLNPDRQRLKLAVTMDKKKLVERTIMGQQSRLSLPNLRAGKHRLNLTPYARGRWLLNNISECRGDQYLKRRVFKLQPNLRFIYQHQAQDAVLSARLYRNITATGRSRIKVQIKALNVQPSAKETFFNSWTYQQRLYDIRSPQGETNILLYASKRLNAGESFFIPFNQDLPAGSYEISISNIDSSTVKNEIYLSLAQVIQGTTEIRRFYRELQFEN